MFEKRLTGFEAIQVFHWAEAFSVGPKLTNGVQINVVLL